MSFQNTPLLEYVAIGNEVLYGQTINTHAAFISRHLKEAGFIITRHTVLPDQKEPLQKGLQEALERNQIVICTGGLGPTCDDNTRQIAAALFDSSISLRPEALQILKERFGNFSSLENQATLPDEAELIPNSLGTAFGCIFHHDNKWLFLLPGVPAEMRAMFLDHVMPYLKRHFASLKPNHTKVIRLFGLPESTVDPELRRLETEISHLAVGIYPDIGQLTVVLQMPAEVDVMVLEKAVKEIQLKFKDNLFDSPSGRFEEAVHLALIQKKQTLSLAESCTGGALAAALTQYSGASSYFLGSFVTYSNALKSKILGVSMETIQKCGAVSQEVAFEMCQGVKEITKSDYSIAVTGIAGPSGGSDDKPVGTVWIAFSDSKQVLKTIHLKARGSREVVIRRAIQASLIELYRILQ